MEKGKRIKDMYNNVFETEEILWLLEGRKKMSAFDFVCECILNIKPENFEDVFMIQKMPEGLMTGCEYRKYILSECHRQWKENQEETYGSWFVQSTEVREEYYQSLYEQYSDMLGKSCSDCGSFARKNGDTYCLRHDEKVSERNYCDDFREL